MRRAGPGCQTRAREMHCWPEAITSTQYLLLLASYGEPQHWLRRIIYKPSQALAGH